MLLARRLCEAGCGFVTVQNPGWDMHADGNNPGIVKGMEMLGRPLDQAVSVFLDDLHDRGLEDDVLLVHHRRLRPHAEDQQPRRPRPLAEPEHALLRRRRTEDGPGDRPIGAAGDVPASEPIGLENLMATVLHALFDVRATAVAGEHPASDRADHRAGGADSGAGVTGRS